MGKQSTERRRAQAEAALADLIREPAVASVERMIGLSSFTNAAKAARVALGVIGRKLGDSGPLPKAMIAHVAAVAMERAVRAGKWDALRDGLHEAGADMGKVRDLATLIGMHGAQPEPTAAWGKSDPYTFTPEPQPEPQPEPIEPEPEPIAAIEPINSQHKEGTNMEHTDTADTLASALRAALAGAVDENKVRAIVAEAVAALPSRTVEKTIVVRDKVAITMPEGEYVRPELADVVTLASQGCNVLLVGPAGSGKSHFAAQVATALGRPFSANSCSAGMSESALSGWLLPVGADGRFTFVASSFVQAYENGGVHLIDEIDAADANTLVFINQALANGGFYLPQRHENPYVKRHADFVCIGAANTYGTGGDRMYVGRDQLDASTLDRFWTVDFGYDPVLESKVASDAMLKWGNALRAKAADLKLRRVVSTRKLAEATRLHAAGMKMERIKEMFFSPWSADERAKVGA